MHDAKGRELKVGDHVLVPCKIRAIHASAEFCNVDLDTVATMPPGTNTSSMVTNTRQVLRANPGDDVTFEVVVDGATVTIR